jgi:CubicO group peptidase (beta-lactamase class C family)
MRSIALVLVAACSQTPPPVLATGSSDDPRFAAVVAYMQQQMEDHDIPGGAIAVIDHGQLFAAAGVGTKREGDDDQVTPKTLFRVASLSKLVTAATAMSLTETGQLALDQPVTAYAPLGLAAGFDPASISIASLLDHTSGVPDITAATVCSVDRSTWFAQNAMEPLWAQPGAVWNYSNRGFGVAGWAIEGAAGEPYETVAAERVLGPAGMTTATFDVAAARASDHAVGHVHDGGTQYYEPDAYDCSALRPAAGVIASVLDYASLAQTLIANDGSMLQPASVAQLETGHADPHSSVGAAEQYGYGLYTRASYKGLRVVRHEGDDPGFQAALWIVPEQQFAVVVLYNASGRRPSHVAENAVDQFLGVADVSAPDDLTAPATWASFAGDYFDPYALGAITVTFDGNALTAMRGTDQLPLAQVGGNEFSATLDGETRDLTFYPNGDGEVAWLVTREGVAAKR